jgi:O-antigen/teichoic acid export membrane protein
MILIASRFSPAQQGFYYTFSSLLGLQIFFELGLLFVIAQFVSHEFVHLKWGERGQIIGDPIALDRFTDLLNKTISWFGIASLLLIAGLIPAGLYFFGLDKNIEPGLAWRIPWVFAVAGTALNLLVTPFLAAVMGSGDVVTVNHREFMGGIASSLLTWLAMIANLGLYAVFAATLGNLVTAWSYLLRQKPELLRLAWKHIFGPQLKVPKKATLSWREEIWPMQWRMAISSGSAFFIFQLFNPILFRYQGPVVAGQMGMTLTAANVLLGSSMVLIMAKSPEFGKLIALRNWQQLDLLFKKVLQQSVCMALLGTIAGWSIISFLQMHYLIGQRFIPAQYAAILFGTICLHVIIGALVVYLRAHKKEPLMLVTLATSLLQGIVTWFLGKHYSISGVTLGYFFITLFVILPAVYCVWKRSRRIWHLT